MRTLVGSQTFQAGNDLGELCLSSPSIAGGRLLIRTASAVYCLTEGSRLPAEIALRRMKKAAAPDIWSAAKNGNDEAVASAIAAGASVNAKNGNGMTPLMLASLYGHTKAADLLLNSKADVSASNNDGNTALHMAAFLAHPKIVRLLLAGRASPEAKNRKGETAVGNLSAPWTEELADVYRLVGNLIGEELDLKRIRMARPVVLKLLKEHVAESESAIAPASDLNRRGIAAPENAADSPIKPAP